MGLLKLEKGQILHKAGTDTVSTVEVLVKGSLKISNPYSSITTTAGHFLGMHHEGDFIAHHRPARLIAFSQQ